MDAEAVDADQQESWMQNNNNHGCRGCGRRTITIMDAEVVDTEQ
jgi:hypothetical protein